MTVNEIDTVGSGFFATLHFPFSTALDGFSSQNKDQSLSREVTRVTCAVQKLSF
jgi:hypothetical protein